MPRLTLMVKGLPFFLLLVGGAQERSGQASKKWAEALAFFQRHAASKEAMERAHAVRGLGRATDENRDPLCWKYVSAVLLAELARERKGEIWVSGEVLEACVLACSKITHKETIGEMVKLARDLKQSPRLRMQVVLGLAPRGPVQDLVELAGARAPLVQLGAIDALRERGPDAAIDAFLKVVKDEERAWEVKLAALEGLYELADDRAVAPLIEHLGKIEFSQGRLKDAYLKILQELLATDLGSDDPNAWRAWAASKKPGNQGVMPPKGSTVTEPTEFYGLETRSSRIVFILDNSGSMAAPILPRTTPPPKPASPAGPMAGLPPKEDPKETPLRAEADKLKRKFDDPRFVKDRLSLAKKEIINAVYNLDPGVHFNVIWFESAPALWKPQLVPATWQNKHDCIKDANRVTPGGGTNIWDSIEMALKLVGSPGTRDVVAYDKNANYATALDGVDTIFFMTDGNPTAGKLSSTNEILWEIQKVHRIRRVTLHTICMGDTVTVPGGTAPMDPADPVFLQRLADHTGGRFVHVK